MIKLLIITKNTQDIIQSIKECLSDYKFSITVCNDVETGIILCRDNKIELVILDIDITEGLYRGIEFFELIKEEEANPFIIAMTENKDFTFFRQNISRGAAGYIYKPIDCNNLKSQIRTLCEDVNLFPTSFSKNKL